MNQKLLEAKLLLLEVITEKAQNLPFGFGEQLGIDGFPKWSIYIDKNNKIYSNDLLFEHNKSIQENLSPLPLHILASLAENGISGSQLFESINNSIQFKYSMCREAIEDAQAFEKDNSKKSIKKNKK